MPEENGQSALDKLTFDAIEVDKLFDVLNYAQTRVGQACLYRTLATPPTDLKNIQLRQEALLEIDSNPALKTKIDELISEAAKREKDFYKLLYNNFLGFFGDPKNDLESEGFGYESYQKGTRFWLNLIAGAKTITPPKSEYLRTLFSQLKAFEKTRVFALMRGPVYCAHNGMITGQEKHWNTPAARFRPTLFKPFFLLFTFGILMALDFFGSLLFDLPSTGSMLTITSTIIFPLFLIAYFAMVGTYDRDFCIFPLRETFRDSPEVHTNLDVIGKLDELLSLSQYAQSFGSYMTMPKLYESEKHWLALTQIRNPILAKDNPNYVPNSIELKDSQLCFITGPNSGGKTAFCKTITQIQLLAQIGSYVPASEAHLSVADHIHYQIPGFSSLKETEGRFGTELKRTKAIFLSTTSKSLVILDELSEGTTYQEKLVTSYNILQGFFRRNNNTILITHNHELVDQFAEEGIGLTKQVEFDEMNPTYRLIDGISRVSHADYVAHRVGFSKEDIDRYLQQPNDKI